MSVFDPFSIHPSPPHYLSYGGLDRKDLARSDSGLIKQLLSKPGTRFVLVWKGLNFFISNTRELNAMQWLARTDVEQLFDQAEFIYLGQDRDQIDYICMDISFCSEESLDFLHSYGQFGDLREADPSISGDEGSILAYAKAMHHWHSRSEYCSVCGSVALSGQAGHIRSCKNSDCGTTHFPRTDAAVIVAVTFEDKILLGRQHNWPEGMMSVLAGFVEPGETLEHAVAREVHEESGIIVRNVCYQHSQPWPFPASLMVGFRAEAVSDQLQINTKEIESARWYSREQILKFDGKTEYLPRKLSISRRLIEEWLAEK